MNTTPTIPLRKSLSEDGSSTVSAILKRSIIKAFTNSGYNESVPLDVLSGLAVLSSTLNITPDRLAEAWEAHSLNRVQRGVDGRLSSSAFVGFRKEMLLRQKRCETSMEEITYADRTSSTSFSGIVANSSVNPAVNPPTNEGEMTFKGCDRVTAADTSYINRTMRGTIKTAYNSYGSVLNEGTCAKRFDKVGSPRKRWPTISIVQPPAATGNSSSVGSLDGGLRRHMFAPLEARTLELERRLLDIDASIRCTYDVGLEYEDNMLDTSDGISRKGDEAFDTDQIDGGSRASASGRYAAWTPVGLPSQNLVLCVGRICNEAHSGRLNSCSILLEGSFKHSFGSRIKLDLGGILDDHCNHHDGSFGSGYSLFPGQIVAVEGNNPLGSAMRVSRIIEGIHPQCKSAHECNISTVDDRSFSIWAACGPYTTSTDLEYDPLLDLIERVVSDKPQVVILCGPFVDARQSLVIGENGVGPSIEDNEGDVGGCGGKRVITPENVFRLKVSSLLAEMYEINPDSGTQFVLVPSLDDAFVDAVYPQAPFVCSGDGRNGKFCDLGLQEVETSGLVDIRTKKSQTRVHLPSNPCTLRIKNVMVGVTSTDILFHLASEGCDGGIPLGSRLARLAGHLVGQGSYYPLFPAPTGMPLDMTKSKEWEIPCMLDVLIVPSRLEPFARVAAYGNGSAGTTLVVNPGVLTKFSTGGTYSRINIQGAKKEIHGVKGNNILDQISATTDPKIHIKLALMFTDHPATAVGLSIIDGDAIQIVFITALVLTKETHHIQSYMEGGNNWSPPNYLSPLQVRITDVPGDGNCLFYCLLREQDVTQVAHTRRKLMDELVRIKSERHDHAPYTWLQLTNDEIQDRNNSDLVGWKVCTSFEEYIMNMLDATPRRALWGGNHEAMLYAKLYEKNIAVYHQQDGSYRLLMQYNYGNGSADDWHLLLLTDRHYQMMNMVQLSQQDIISNSKLSSICPHFGLNPKTFSQKFDATVRRLEHQIEILIQTHVLLGNTCFTWSSLLELAKTAHEYHNIFNAIGECDYILVRMQHMFQHEQRTKSEWWHNFTAGHFDILCKELPRYNLNNFGNELFPNTHRFMTIRRELRENNIHRVEDHPFFNGHSSMGLTMPVRGYTTSSRIPSNHWTKSSIRKEEHQPRNKRQRTDWTTKDLWAWVKEMSDEDDKEDTVNEGYSPPQKYSEFVDLYQSNKECLIRIINKIIDGCIYLGSHGDLPWHPLDWSCLLSVASNSVVYHELYQKLLHYDKLILQQQEYYNKHKRWKRSLAQRKLDDVSMDLPEYNLMVLGSKIWESRDANSTWDEESFLWRGAIRMQPKPSSYYASRISNRHKESENVVDNSSSEEDPFVNHANEEYTRQRVIDETDSSQSVIDDTTEIKDDSEHSLRLSETSLPPYDDNKNDIHGVREHSTIRDGHGEQGREPREMFNGLLRSVAGVFSFWKRSTAPCDHTRSVTNGTSDTTQAHIHDLNADFDSFVIRSSCVGKMIETVIPSHIPIQISGTRHSRTETGVYENYLCIASNPFEIYIKKEYKESIILKLNDLRGGPHTANKLDDRLLINPISLSSKQFATITTDVNVDMIIIRGFGYKANLDMCIDLFKLAREADYDCSIEYDLGFNLDVFQLHLFQKNSNIPIKRMNSSDGQTKRKQSYIPLVAAPPTNGLSLLFGDAVKAHHFPKYSIATQTMTGMKFKPIYGSVNIFPGWRYPTDIQDFEDDQTILGRGINESQNKDILKIKVYSTEHHARKRRTRMKMFQHSITGKQAKRRCNVFHQVLEDLNIINPKLRIEITSSLPVGEFASAHSIPSLENAFSIQKRACCGLVSVLDIFYLPVDHVCKTMRLVLDFAQNGAPPLLPGALNAFRLRDNSKLTTIQRMFVAMIFQNCGEVSELTNRVFHRTWKKGRKLQSRPLEWLLWNVYRHYFRNTGSLGKPSALKDYIDNDIYVGPPHRARMIKPLRSEIDDTCQTGLLLPPDILVEDWSLYLHGTNTPRMEIDNGVWQRDHHLSNEWMFEFEHFDQDNAAFPYRETPCASSIFHRIIMGFSCPPLNGKNVNQFIQKIIDPLEDEPEIREILDHLDIQHQKKSDGSFLYRANYCSGGKACTASSKYEVCRKILKRGRDGDLRCKEWKSELKTRNFNVRTGSLRNGREN